MEDLVWNSITESGKSKFDYKSFENQFIEFDLTIPENILFMVIIGLASEKKEKIIALEIVNQLLMAGLKVDLADIELFIQNKNIVLSKEIYCAQLAHSMLQEGNNPLGVLNAINQLLN